MKPDVRKHKIIGYSILGIFLVLVALAAEKFHGPQDSGIVAVVPCGAMERMQHAVNERPAAWARSQASIESATRDIAIASGQAIPDVADAMSQFAVLTHNIDDAETLAADAVEIAAGTHKSLPTVTYAIIEAAGGSGGAIERLDPQVRTMVQNHAMLDQVMQKMHKQYHNALEDTHNDALVIARENVELSIEEDKLRGDLGLSREARGCR